ncbi:DUF3014 domain-containing protein [Paraglaciecola arctica]|uniref:DUF3014 domain-containing protein n=1 Tax=Paraglaciecola arctica BSs20135 TaxID=493475 RepID=K6XZB7_9ALTE|nr:DUF3014 domain-containing protein [Paraglaciecola arctica]GAC17006.1 hypothetical protein GARC_0024 [Paraglaciecola arctica BSs20135]
MSEESKKSLVPHFTIGAIVLAIVLAVVFWPSEPEPEPVIVMPEPPVIIEPVIEEQPTMLIPEPVVEQPEPEIIPEPEPLDISDGTIKTKLLTLSDYDTFARLLINDALLERFVIMTNTLAEDGIAANNRILVKPEKPFRTYRQADKEWIDPASFKRYAPYVEVLESLETASLLQLYQEYKPAIEKIFSEIGSPSDNFEEKLKDAIDVLLDTPEVPFPVEVYTESVMFKFKDTQLESLTAPQKQLLRTGPENMRRIKAKLREIKETL